MTEEQFEKYKEYLWNLVASNYDKTISLDKFESIMIVIS